MNKSPSIVPLLIELDRRISSEGFKVAPTHPDNETLTPKTGPVCVIEYSTDLLAFDTVSPALRYPVFVFTVYEKTPAKSIRATERLESVIMNLPLSSMDLGTDGEQVHARKLLSRGFSMYDRVTGSYYGQLTIGFHLVQSLTLSPSPQQL